MISLTHSDIVHRFGKSAVLRGREYHKSGCVENLRTDAKTATIHAEVQGTRRKPYRVAISIARQAGKASLVVGNCSCPVGSDCKHVVATLLAYLDRQMPATMRGTLLPDDPETKLIDAWLDTLDASADAARSSSTATSEEQVFYVVDTRVKDASPIAAFVARRLPDGRSEYVRPYLPELTGDTAPYTQTSDVTAGILLRAFQQRRNADEAPHARLFESLLSALLATGRFHADDPSTPPLRAGAPRAAGLGWRTESDGKQTLRIDPPNERTCILMGAAPWYIDMETREAGLLQLDAPPALLPMIARAPTLSPAQAARVSQRLTKRGARAPIPPPRTFTSQTINERPIPTLLFLTREALQQEFPPGIQHLPDGRRILDELRLAFEYGGAPVSPFEPELSLTEVTGATIIKRRRDPVAENQVFERLGALGLRQGVAPAAIYGVRPPFATFFLPQGDARAWLALVHAAVPRLREQGWRIDVDPSFRHSVLELDEEAAWEAELTENEQGWFDCEVGIHVAGEKISLLPILLRMLREDRREIERLLAEGNADAHLFIPTEKGILPLPLRRVRAILETFLELLDPQTSGNGVSLPPAWAALLQGEDDAHLLWKTPQHLRELGAKLASFSGIEPIDPPQALQANLRPYQREGVSWLQFLRAYGFGGILADDMGLGKTIQTLTHLLVEKEAGRLTHPTLLIVPTSLVHNWLNEASRFTPSLRTLSLHGPDRAERFKAIKCSDLVISTYPLLVRDEILAKTRWSFVVLDEAQTVKNAATKGAQAIRDLKAEHRLCLTGTPIENHLGELWAQFDFLMPGVLGTLRRFTHLFRTPIEQRGDDLRRASLSKRVRPFILRRTKNDVARELPPKTEIVRRVELAGAQRDLYETIRLAMHQRVREQIAEHGLARSRIVILDALLKLRQACCDPRLVKVPAARKVKSSAKLEELRAMLPQLLEEGRRMLIFSQFTSLLDLVEPELEALEIPYVQIRGTTRDRRTPVERFQAGEFPVFLISLKAGGTGLNLTAADTVIHLDPWWNPAVERQATDRAHRIGQTNKVFVYKLIAAGTVEERILEMQARKAAIAESLFSENADAKLALEADDLDFLFGPMEGE